jgi:protein-disulfide isomerase
MTTLKEAFMQQLRPSIRLSSIGLGLMLLLLALVAAACAPSTAPPATARPATALPATSAPAVEKAGPVAPSAPTVQPRKAVDAPVGVDADGNFYRGNPNAPVKLVEFSDFQ